jgi:hypothetical protein
MQAYRVRPADYDVHATQGEPSARVSAMVAETVFASLRLDQDPTVHAIFFNRAPKDAPHEDLGDRVYLVRPVSPAGLKQWIVDAVDPFFAGACQIRSSLTCRCVVFRYDGQALLCIRADDLAPISPDPSLVVVEQCPELIAPGDYFDGYAPERA